ncbi:PilT/PilU family type 4a pilus ATPase [Magnetovirga frankeli]|uniref:PilT/PilU family type 4a pilus ATPase n=1 Tax=Magnetovirga frankeli TaxID=947516 RepID=UPI001293E2E1|nr:PilT/PilU family type 4a pilus ATPase [gamma proteobacterium SS-5]
MAVDLPKILQIMVKNDGADVFFHTGAKITIKTPNGFAQLGERLQPGETEQAVRENLPEKKFAELEKTGELDFSLAYRGIGRFRGNAFRQRGEISLVLRQIPTEVPTIDQLGLPEVLKKLMMEKNGLIIVVGATGSGKSTSLAAMIDHVNSNKACHILTLEDPIEFMHNHKKSIVAQREIGSDTESFSAGMKSALREAPNVILLGEIRDVETMEYSLKFANTGHLALSTLHANNSSLAIERMLGFYDGSEREALAQRVAQNLKAIVCQRLVPKIGGGKKAVIEIMVNTPRIADLIEKMELGEIKEMVEKGTNYGMQSFDQHLVQLFFDGIIEEQTVYDYADSVANAKLKIRAEETGKRIAEGAGAGDDSKVLGGLSGISLIDKDEDKKGG